MGTTNRQGLQRGFPTTHRNSGTELRFLQVEEASEPQSDSHGKPVALKRVSRELQDEVDAEMAAVEGGAEAQLQKLCDICAKPVFSFSLRRHMELHARREAEWAAKVRVVVCWFGAGSSGSL